MRDFPTSYNPNATSAFCSMRKQDLKEFYEWFMRRKPYCIEEMRTMVRDTPGYENWESDYSLDSLDRLGDWFVTKVQKRDLTPEEIEYVKSTLPFPIEITTWTLTDDTRSLALAVGMYFGEVVLKNGPGLRWEQEWGMYRKKKLGDYGQPVIAGEGFVSKSPVRVAHVIASGIIDGTHSGKDFREGYDAWMRNRANS